MKSSSVSPARRVAFEVLQRVADGAFASVLLASREEELSPRDRALTHELVFGVLRWQLWLDRLIELYANRDIHKLDPAVRIILRLGLYQLRFLTRVPASAAVNESVNLVNLVRLRSAGGLVNAVLRRATREPDVDPGVAIEDPMERVVVSTSHPRWLIERWTRAFGSQEAEAFARANNEPAPVAFRVVQNSGPTTEILGQLREAGADVVQSELTPNAWRITNPGPLFSEFVARAEIYIQDEASQLVAQAVEAQTGNRVLDLCAAPGGKTTLIAGGVRDASIVASDFYEHRLRTVVSSAKAQGLINIQCVVLDALRSLPMNNAAFDRVLVDAPCSGTGTLRRNPEIRWRISASDIAELAGNQLCLLSNAARLVKPGGRLIYSTCSVEPDENETVVAKFLENQKDYEFAELNVPSAVITSAGQARTWPHRQDTDGFFLSALSRKIA